MKLIYNEFLPVNTTDIVPLDFLINLLGINNLHNNLNSIVNNNNLNSNEKIKYLKNFEENFYKELKNLNFTNTLNIANIKEINFLNINQYSTNNEFFYKFFDLNNNYIKKFLGREIIYKKNFSIVFNNVLFIKISSSVIYTYNKNNYQNGICCFFGIEKKYAGLFLFKHLIDTYYSNTNIISENIKYFINNGFIKLYTNEKLKYESKKFYRKLINECPSFIVKKEELSEKDFNSIFISDKTINFKNYFNDLDSLKDSVVNDFLNGIKAETLIK